MSRYATRGSQPVVGFTTPAVTYEKMRSTDSRTRIHNADVGVFSTDVVYGKAWQVWYARWREFFEGTMDSKWSNTLRSDEMAAQAAQYEQEFQSLLTTWANMKDAKGNPLPSNTPRPPQPIVPPEEGISLWSVLAVIAGVGVCVGGYFLVKKQISILRAKRDALEGVLPMLLAPQFGAQGAQAITKVATARDAFAEVTQAACECARDLEIRPVPRAAAKYIMSGF